MLFLVSVAETSEDVHPQQLCGSNREEAICTKMGDPTWFSTWHYPNKNLLSLTENLPPMPYLSYMLNTIIYSWYWDLFYSIAHVKWDLKIIVFFYEINILILWSVFMAGHCMGVWRDTGERNARRATEASFPEIWQPPEWESDSRVSTCCGRSDLKTIYICIKIKQELWCKSFIPYVWLRVLSH